MAGPPTLLYATTFFPVTYYIAHTSLLSRTSRRIESNHSSHHTPCYSWFFCLSVSILDLLFTFSSCSSGLIQDTIFHWIPNESISILCHGLPSHLSCLRTHQLGHISCGQPSHSIRCEFQTQLDSRGWGSIKKYFKNLLSNWIWSKAIWK